MGEIQRERDSGQSGEAKTKVTAYLPTVLVRFAQHYAVDEDTSLTAILSKALEVWATAHGYQEDGSGHAGPETASPT
jgi:hypothetical protein